MLGQFDAGGSLQVDAHASRHIVNDDRHRAGIGNGLEVGLHAALVGLVVIRHHTQDALYAREVLCFDGVDDGLCVVASHAEHDG